MLVYGLSMCHLVYLCLYSLFMPVYCLSKYAYMVYPSLYTRCYGALRRLVVTPLYVLYSMCIPKTQIDKPLKTYVDKPYAGKDKSYSGIDKPYTDINKPYTLNRHR